MLLWLRLIQLGRLPAHRCTHSKVVHRQALRMQALMAVPASTEALRLVLRTTTRAATTYRMPTLRR